MGVPVACAPSIDLERVHQGAGRIANPGDDDALALIADLGVLGVVLIDEAAVIARDAIVGVGLGVDSINRASTRFRIELLRIEW